VRPEGEHAGGIGGWQRAEAALQERGCTDWLIGALIVTLGVGMIAVWLMW
jgi:hypothetical protein